MSPIELQVEVHKMLTRIAMLEARLYALDEQVAELEPIKELLSPKAAVGLPSKSDASKRR